MEYQTGSNVTCGGDLGSVEEDTGDRKVDHGGRGNRGTHGGTMLGALLFEAINIYSGPRVSSIVHSTSKYCMDISLAKRN